MGETNFERTRDWLKSVVDIDCRSGLYDETNILEAVEELIAVELGEPHPELFAELAAAAKAGLAAHARLEATWTARTANDALDDAFRALSERGILARQALGSTMQEGWVRAAEAAAGGQWRGAVFYHRQDLESCLEGDPLFLRFGSFESDDDAPVAEIGKEVMFVLSHYGVSASWNGDAKRAIEIAPFAWQRRRSTQAPAGPEAPGAMPAPPPPPEPCALCNGRGWLAPATPQHFPELCACKR